MPGAESDQENRSGAQAVERALAVLECFVESAGELDQLGITEIAQRTGLQVSTTHRIVRALVRGGLVAQDERTERYHLGRGAVVLGQVATAQLGLPLAVDELRGLVGTTGESTSLGYRDGADVVVLLRVESPHPLRFQRAAGSRERLHASAMGKALLAFDADRYAAVAALPPLAAFTPRTTTKRSALLAELEVVHERGWALNDEERHVGVRAIGAPVLDRRGIAIAAVAVQGPVARLSDDRLADVAQAVIATAAAVEPSITW